MGLFWFFNNTRLTVLRTTYLAGSGPDLLNKKNLLLLSGSFLQLPKSLIETYTKLVGANPGTRPNPRDVVEDLRKPGQFFRNDLIETLLFLEEIHLKDANEKHK